MGGTYDDSLYKIPFVLDSCLYNRETCSLSLKLSSIVNNKNLKDVTCFICLSRILIIQSFMSYIVVMRMNHEVRLVNVQRKFVCFQPFIHFVQFFTHIFT